MLYPIINLTENARVCLIQIPIIDGSDVFLSFLPHCRIVFERTAYLPRLPRFKGCKIAFAQSFLELLAKNMGEVRPTIMRLRSETVRTEYTTGP